MKLRFRFGDGVVVAAVLLLACLFAAAPTLFGSTGSAAYVSVRHEGAETARYALTAAGVYAVSADFSIEIQNQTVRVVHADCPDQLCVRMGAIRHAGQTLVCLPNRVIIRIVSQKGDGYDAVL